MPTFKAVVLEHQKRKDGTYNVKIRVTHNSKQRYLPTSYYVAKDDLTRGSLKLKNRFYIDATDDLIREYRSVCDKAGRGLETMSVEQVLQLIKDSRKGEFELDIVKYGRDWADKLEDKELSVTPLSFVHRISCSSLWINRPKHLLPDAGSNPGL